MIEVDKGAVEQLKQFREQSGTDSCVRIGILSGSTSGPTLGVSVDDKTDRDEVFSYGDLEVIIDKALLSYCEIIAVEFVYQEGGGCSGAGFRITPQKPI
ncbi:MAG TPA: hypothetical protein VJ969_11570 [Desulfopila sp.]|nr:hypothetical protein [Desulfopila sp.]